MHFAIGSTNRTKIAACKAAVAELLTVFPEESENETRFTAIASQTDVADMPLSAEEIMKGALQRALFVYENVPDIDFAVGMEGGVHLLSNPGRNAPTAYLQNWVYAYDGRRGFFGSSPALPLPEVIRKALYEEGQELAEIIDTLSGQSDVRSKNGAFGTLTRDLITRTDSFKWAVIAALTPFRNKNYYG